MARMGFGGSIPCAQVIKYQYHAPRWIFDILKSLHIVNWVGKYSTGIQISIPCAQVRLRLRLAQVDI